MDEQLVVTAQTLQLNPSLERADMPGGVMVLKNVPARKYLTVSYAQWNLLRNFVNPATAPDVLRAVILNRSALPLREYYELIIKARAVGVLLTSRQTTAPIVHARQWWLPLEPYTPIVLTLAGLIAVITMLAIRPLPLPTVLTKENVIGLLIGWGTVCVALSLGYILAASVLRKGGGEVYEFKPKWLSFTPHLHVDLGDAQMMGRTVQAGVWGALTTPLVLAVLAMLIWRPQWAAVPVLGMLFLLRPIGGGAVIRVFSALSRGHVLDTQKDLVFSLNKRWRVRLALGFARVSFAYVALRIVWGMLWVGFMAFLVCRAANIAMKDLLFTEGYWIQVAEVLGLIFGLVALVVVGVPASRALWQITRTRAQQIRQWHRRWFGSKTEEVSDEVLLRALADSMLFRRLPPADRAELIKVGKVVRHGAMKTLMGFADAPSQVGVIVIGKVSLYRRLLSGRPDCVARLREGDVFGAHALLDSARANMQVRTTTPVVAFVFPVEEFKLKVIGRLGLQVTNDLVHKFPFLRDSKICRQWHPQAVVRFCQLSSVLACDDGSLIVEEKQDNHQFFIVYEGQVSVRRSRRMRAKLGVGHFFGEIGLLQNSTATADVMARGQVRCLTISKTDFLRFMTHNPVVGLQLERVSSRRLGCPIFPLQGSSFDIR